MKLSRQVLPLLLLLSACSFADTLSLGSAANYTVLGMQGTTINNSLGTINGNEGIARYGSITNQAPFTVTGNVYEYASGQISGPGHVNGSINVNSALLTQNNTDALNAWTQAAGMTATQTVTGGLTSSLTINGTGGVNVININGNVNLNNANLTLNGSANDVFIVNISGNVQLVGTAAFTLSGATTANHVLYNLTSSSCSVSTNIGDAVYGTLLGPHCSFNLDGGFYGAIIGGDSSHGIALLSGVTLNNQSFTPPVPEPASLLLLASGLPAIIWRKRNTKRP